MPSKYETAVYTREQLENARTKGQLIGWAQGAVSVGILLFLLNFLGWIPLLFVGGLVGFGAFRFITRKK